MIIKITSKSNLDTIYGLNPGHFNGTYATELGESILTKHREEDCIYLQALTPHVSGSNQLALSNVCGPEVGVRILTEMCRNILKGESFLDSDVPWVREGAKMQDIDEPTEIKVEIPVVYLTTTWFNLLEKHYEIESTKVGWNLYSLKWEVFSTHYKVVNELYFLLMMLASSNGESYIHNAQIEKTIRSVQSMPYFFAYLAGHRLIRSEAQFEELKDLLASKVKGHKVSLVQGNTHDLRIKTITDQIDPTIAVFDVGCGELRYAKKLSRKFEANYYAFDVEDQESEVYHLKERRGMDVTFVTNLDELIITEPVQVIISEVVEHMTVPDLVLLGEYLQTLNIHSIHITTPNVEFNEYYGLKGFRHPEHLRELTAEGFQNLLKSSFPLFEWEYKGIGDTVDGEQPTHYAVCYVKSNT